MSFTHEHTFDYIRKTDNVYCIELLFLAEHAALLAIHRKYLNRRRGPRSVFEYERILDFSNRFKAKTSNTHLIPVLLSGGMYVLSVPSL